MTNNPPINCEITNRSQNAVYTGLEYLDSMPTIPNKYNNPVERVKDPFDISSLRFHKVTFFKDQKKQINLTPTLVTNFIEKINSLKDINKTFIIGIGTGGTIAMSPTGPGGSLEPDLNFDSIMEKSDPRLKDDFEILGLDAYATDSSQLEIDDIGDMAIAMAYIWKNMKPKTKKRGTDPEKVEWK